jgi:MFS family permease
MIVAFLFGSMLWIAQVTIDSSSYGIVASKIPSNVRGKYFGYYNTIFFLSFGIGTTLLTGPLSDYLISINYDHVFAYSIAYLVAAFVVAVGLIIALILYIQTKKNESKTSMAY